MAKVCSKCGNNLYGNKTKCPFCGEPIRGGGASRTSSSSYRSSSNNNLSSRNYNNNNSNNSGSYNGYTGSNNRQQPRPRPTYNNTSRSADTGGAGWGLLGFCIPLVGIILYLVWQEEKPYTAKACLNGALISILIGFVFGLFASCGSMAGY